MVTLCLTLAGQMLGNACEVIVKHLGSRYQAHAKLLACNTVIFAGHFYPVEELKFHIDIKHFNPLIVPWGTLPC